MTDTIKPPSPGVIDGNIQAVEWADELASTRLEVVQLQQAMQTRAPIEQSEGMLMLRFGLDDDRALAVLVRWSRGANIKAHTVARLLVDAVARGERLPELSTPGIPSWLSSASETVTNSPPAGDAPTQPPADR